MGNNIVGDHLTNVDRFLFSPPASSYEIDDEHLVWSPLPDGDEVPLFVIKPAKEPPGKRRGVIYLHANACDVGGAFIEENRLCRRLNAYVICPEYPGFGVNDRGPPSIAGVDDACWVAFTYAVDVLRIAADQLVLFGRSIGTGPVCSLAAHLAGRGINVGAVVLVAPYLSIRKLVSSMGTFAFASGLLPDEWDNEKALEKVKSPLLVIHGEIDEVIPIDHGRKLSEKAVSRRKVGLFPKQWAHNTTTPQNLREIIGCTKRFLRQHTSFDDAPSQARSMERLQVSSGGYTGYKEAGALKYKEPSYMEAKRQVTMPSLERMTQFNPSDSEHSVEDGDDDDDARPPSWGAVPVLPKNILSSKAAPMTPARRKSSSDCPKEEFERGWGLFEAQLSPSNSK